MTKKGCLWGWLAGTVGLLVIFLTTMILIESLLGQQMRFPTYGAHIGLVRIEGVIVYRNGGFGINCGDDAINNITTGNVAEWSVTWRTYGSSYKVKSGQWNPILNLKKVK